ncbi:NAD(P)-binding protein [Xylariaceae sp. FL1019]|nr:NAD(P)-binding protein [Xylariaceae sp. FL1019]
MHVLFTTLSGHGLATALKPLFSCTMSFRGTGRGHHESTLTFIKRPVPLAQYPNVNIIQGSFDDAEVIASAAAGADIIIHSGDGDHENALKAIIRGLLRRDRKSFLIELSGTGLLYEYPNTTEYLGRYNAKAYSDVEDIAELVSRPGDALHRRTDAIVLNAAADHGHVLKTAIVCPPDIYGRGSGPGRTVSYYIPRFVEAIQKLGKPFYLDAGSNMKGWIHIQDLVQTYVALVEAAAAGGGEVSCGSEGYFCAATQEFSQKEIAVAAARILHGKGLLPSTQAQSISRENMAALFPHAPETGFFSFCCNSRSKSDRAAKELGYVAKGPSFWDTLESDLLDALATKQ